MGAVIVQYLEFNKNYYVLIMTMKKATPDILKLLVGVLPFVMAWTVIGNVVFGTYSDRFKSIRSTAVELFAVRAQPMCSRPAMRGILRPPTVSDAALMLDNMHW